MKKFEQQYNEFKDNCMKMTNKELYNEYYKICFFENLNDIIEQNEWEQSEYGDYQWNVVCGITKLIEEDKLTMNSLYDEFLNTEYASCSNWEELLDFLYDINKEYEVEEE